MAWCSSICTAAQERAQLTEYQAEACKALIPPFGLSEHPCLRASSNLQYDMTSKAHEGGTDRRACRRQRLRAHSLVVWIMSYLVRGCAAWSNYGCCWPAMPALRRNARRQPRFKDTRRLLLRRRLAKHQCPRLLLVAGVAAICFHPSETPHVASSAAPGQI